jgi:DNA-binding NarL/FixJ family response regulator
MKRVVIVEDHEDMRFAYSVMFRRSTTLEIVKQVETAEEASEAIPAMHPDLAIVDISLPGKDGITLTRELRRQYPDLKILIVTGHDPEAYEKAAREAGADDFVQKGSSREIRARTYRLLGVPEGET